MATIRKNELNKIKKLYLSGYSAREIAAKMRVKLDAVYYFFRNNKIPRRSAVESNRLLFERKLPSFKIKSSLTARDKLLKLAGIMLYWGEGSQWPGENIVDFANSNPEMITIFLKFLRDICGIDNKKLRAYLYCYKNQNIEEILQYWSRLTKIPFNQFTKPYVRLDYKKVKEGKMVNGLIHIRYYDKKLLNLIRQWIINYINNGSVA